MNYLSLSQLVSVSELQRNYNSLLETVKKIGKPLILLRRNQPEAVLISVKTYQDLTEKKRLYEEKVALDTIINFEKEKKKGKLLAATKAEDLFK